MINPLEVTCYMRTGYNPSDEPASDAVIEQNDKLILSLLIKEYDPLTLASVRLELDDAALAIIDYIKIRDTSTNDRWFYYVSGHRRINEKVAEVGLVLDAFATAGLENISFFGNIARRSLSANERTEYPLLPEPWGPRRPLKVRRMIIDLNVNKSMRIPAHISTTFEEEESRIEHPENPVEIQVPNSPLHMTTFTDSLAYSAEVPMGYPNAAASTTHTITTPWGSVSYVTPYEQYHSLSGNALATFLAKAKKYNAADLIYPPFFLPSPPSAQSIQLHELSNAATRNIKASRHYTTVTIRSLASNSSRTFSDSDTDLQFNQTLVVAIAPDKNGGIYVIPSTIRDTGLHAYMYLEGVYSPFETVMQNAVGDTAAKFASDGTTILNTALANLFQSYIGKINALQYESMQAKYFKDLGAVKGMVMSFAAELLGSVSTTVTSTKGYTQESTTTTPIPTIQQRTTGTQTTGANTGTNSGTQNVGSRTITQGIDQYGSHGSDARYQYSSGSLYQVNTTFNAQTVNRGNINEGAHTISSSGSFKNDAVSSSSDNTTTVPGYTQTSTQRTPIPDVVSTAVTEQEGGGRSVQEGVQIAEQGIEAAYNSQQYGGAPSWGTLQTMLFGGYRNEAHTFMLGNLNDYLNRWVSIQNDIHNGKVANLFKNVNLIGTYDDHNKLAGKFEIVVASLQPEDEYNFDLFLDHFGHAVDEYSDKLVQDAQPNYNYTMVGEDAALANSRSPSLSARILNQFRTGVRVWKTLVRPENY